MKFCIIIIAVLFAVACSGQTTSCSPRIQNEVQTYLSNLRGQVGNAVNNLKQTIQGRVNQYFSQFNNLRDRIVSRLNGAGATTVAQKVNTEFNDIANFLKDQFSCGKLDQLLKTLVESVQSQYIDPIQRDINALKAQADKNPKVCKCYDDNKLALKSIFDTVASQTQTIVKDELAQLDVQIQALATAIKAAVDRIENDLKSCTTSACVTQYVN
jgi:hypothetical protein